MTDRYTQVKLKKRFPSSTTRSPFGIWSLSVAVEFAYHLSQPMITSASELPVQLGHGVDFDFSYPPTILATIKPAFGSLLSTQNL